MERAAHVEEGGNRCLDVPSVSALVELRNVPVGAGDIDKLFDERHFSG
jgi:hypothetical protein